MADFKNMTVQALRALARKALGRGYSKLTKSELVAALEAAEKKAGKAADTVKRATGRAARATQKVVEEAQGGAERARKAAREKREAGAKKKPAGKAGRAAQRAGRAVQTLRETAEAAAAAAVAGARAVVAAARGEEEPDPESYFVARVRGEAEAKKSPHPMTEGALERSRKKARPGAALDAEDLEDQAAEEAAEEEDVLRARAPAGDEPAPAPHPAYDEGLGELPWSYGDDAFVALPRDPRTLFLYWDYNHDTLAAAFHGLESARAQLWVFGQRADGGWDRVRTMEFALESRSFYVHDLEPGRVYRAEVHLLDRRGQERALSQPSNDVLLPPFGPSPILDDRFARIPWGESLIRWLRQSVAGGAFSPDLRAQLARLSDWSRFGPGKTWGGSGSSGAGGMGGRPSSPGSPNGPWGGEGI
ncbi:DUF4912 domain-containing protein [Anaeromyxobacter paludicola]|nr:DUF4912 domain-containing protein [Anaeromyxobacter paludicola]